MAGAQDTERGNEPLHPVFLFGRLPDGKNRNDFKRVASQFENLKVFGVLAAPEAANAIARPTGRQKYQSHHPFKKQASWASNRSSFYTRAGRQ